MLGQGPDDPEADEGRIRVPPDALGPLGVLHAPFGVGRSPRGTAQTISVIIPGTAASHVGVFLGVGQHNRASRDRVRRGESLVKVGDVMVQAPFRDVAVNVVETPRVWFLLADRLRFLGVLDIPCVIAELSRIVTKEIRGLGSRAAGVFPLGLGGQPVGFAGLGG